ncbi:MAG: hypothetical protein HOH64_05875 [Rhodospirillales bacterium]|nr:hypothetical protein [Rhodospirillales bacterium]
MPITKLSFANAVTEKTAEERIVQATRNRPVVSILSLVFMKTSLPLFIDGPHPSSTIATILPYLRQSLAQLIR